MVAPTNPHGLIVYAEARQRAAKSVAVVIVVVTGVLGALSLPASAQSGPWSTRIQQIPVGAFILMMSRDPITDVEDRLLVTTPLESGNGEPVRSEPATLSWTCVLNDVRVLFDQGGHGEDLAEADDQVAVQYRFGDKPASPQQQWDLSFSHRGVWVPISQVAAFTREAQSSSEVVIRVTSPTLPQRTEVFGLQGLSEGLPSLPCYRP